MRPPGRPPRRRAPWRAPALSFARGRGLRLRLRNTLICVFSLVQVSTAFSVARVQDTVHQHPAALAGWNAGLPETCQPGFYLSEHSASCMPCTNGRDFTNHSNTLSSCQLCSKCFPDKDETAPCTRTMDTQCRCKPGTFQDDESPEFCQKCSPECPAGKVEARLCTPWNDRECVDQESGSSRLDIIIPATFGILLLLTLAVLFRYRNAILQGCAADTNCMNRIFSWHLCAPRRPEDLDNARNAILSGRDSLSKLAPEEELEHQRVAEPAGVAVEPPREAERLLRPDGAEGSQRRRGLLVPANSADPIGSMRPFFDYFADQVPFDYWKLLMRSLDLTDNEIQVAKAQAPHPREHFYEMMVTWTNKMGRGISVNTLLDALETLGLKSAKEKIEDHLVVSGKYIYGEDAAGPAVS